MSPGRETSNLLAADSRLGVRLHKISVAKLLEIVLLYGID